MEGTKRCPFCAETIHVEALVCRYCDYDLRTGKPSAREPLHEEPTNSLPKDTEVPAKRSVGRRLAGLLGRVVVTAAALVVGLIVFVIWLGGYDSAAPGGCTAHVEIHSAETWAKELGRALWWVEANHRVNLWSHSSATGSKGRPVGGLRPGDHALVIEEDGSDYLVKSPRDGAVGWVSGVQVARVVWLDSETKEACR